MPFEVIICGAGLAGLGASIALRKKGHKVTILEGTAQLAEVGAGIQIPPNSSRILKAYGVYDDIKKAVVSPRNIQVRRYCTGDIIGKTPLDPTMREQYGYPYWLIHRADYQRCLREHAEQLGVEIRLNSFVDTVHDEGQQPVVTLRNDTQLTADIVVGADGIRSRTRSSILGEDHTEAMDSSQCAYRATVPAEVMRGDPATEALLSDTSANCWVGDGRHIMAYPIMGGKMYNLVLPHLGRASVGAWNEPGDLEEMKLQYDSFDPTIRKVLDKVTSCLKWKLADLPPLSRWVSEKGRAVIIGDAAHAMVPYLAQGAAMSIEDGAALAECLERTGGDRNLIPRALHAVESIRKPRCEIVQEASRGTGDMWHKPDGPEQQQRDQAIMASLEGRRTRARNPNRWSHEQFQPWLFGYDTFRETNRELDKAFTRAGRIRSLL